MNDDDGGDASGVEWLTSISVQDICHLRSTLNEDVVRGLFCLYGSWNKDVQSAESVLKQWRPTINRGRKFVAGMVRVDESDESMEVFCGDNDCPLRIGCHPLPDELPALLAAVQDSSSQETRVQIVSGVTARDIILEGASPRIMTLIKATFNSLILGVQNSSPADRKRKISASPARRDALRIFVAGDRANVGKTSVCLGMLGSLVAMGYEPSSIAYIKPATQDESKQLLQMYCERVGIHCVPIGPIVFYKGFTRAFLAGEAESSTEMLHKVSAAVNELAAGKRVVIIDGVGYPAVGSICGVDNASVALACGYSEQKPPGVILVGPSGVGHAVDSFNLNCNYFEARQVPVMGAIFNKLSLDGYYSLENCRDQVSSYFHQYQLTRTAFGFLPVFPELGGEDAMDHLDDFFRVFAENVDVNGILASAMKIQTLIPSAKSSSPVFATPAKKTKVGSTHNDSHDHHPGHAVIANPHAVPRNGNKAIMSRQQIEEHAAAAGAQDSC
ncbi:hypothetical protein MHU86_6129 [Fragilaria crotonensis]|nr:hypothetical protein MHU86_6129 [Fragilaria crotonensis]